MESDFEIREKVERQFDLELAAVRQLNQLSERLLALWPTVRGSRNEADRILAMAIARGTTTFNGTLHLIEGGFGREAQMLNRSLFEGMAVAHWIAANPEQAEERFAKANEFEIHLMREKVGELHPEVDSVGDAGRLSAAQLEEAKRLFGRDNQKLWTGHRSVWDLLKEIEDQWEEPGRSTLLLYMKFEHQRNTKEMHATASALFGSVLDPAAARNGMRGISMRVGPGPDAIDGALFNAFFNHSNLLSLLIDHYELGEEAAAEVRQVTGENQYAFAVIAPEDARGIGRNDPCPCGSEKKFKACHWDRMHRKG